MAFRHILVPYDGSGQAELALDKAIWLAEQSAAKLTVAHVINLAPIIIGEMSFSPPTDYQQRLQEQASGLLEAIKGKLVNLPNAERIVLGGSPAGSIVSYAETEQCDLIVMGSRGLGALKEFVLGSVSHNVLQHAKIPVLIIK